MVGLAAWLWVSGGAAAWACDAPGGPDPCVSPSATVDPSTTLGLGARVGAGAVVGPNLNVGAGSTVGARAHLVGDDVGGTRTGPFAIGAGAAFGRRASIGADGIVGAGAMFAADVVVGRDLTAGADTTVGYAANLGAGVTLLDDAVVGNLVAVGDGATIGARATVGRSASVGAGASVGDDAQLAADVEVAAGVPVGANARLRAGASVATGATIGAGAVLARDVTVGAGAQVGSNARIGAGATIPAGEIVGSNQTVARGVVFEDGIDPCAASPAVGALCGDGTVYAGLTPDGSVKMYTTRCDLGQTWTAGSCTGARAPASWNNGGQNWVPHGLLNEATGAANTAAIVGFTDSGAPYNAAIACSNLVANGHSDWYLPAIDELEVVRAGKVAIGGFTGADQWVTFNGNDVNYGRYWSSTERASNPSIFAVHVNMVTGVTDPTTDKHHQMSIRCVRH
jgi:UDP-3-O-[3-hydroxymyristoyl] glucosamine N-acyltransferase